MWKCNKGKALGDTQEAVGKPATGLCTAPSGRLSCPWGDEAPGMPLVCRVQWQPSFHAFATTFPHQRDVYTDMSILNECMDNRSKKDLDATFSSKCKNMGIYIYTSSVII